MDRRGFIKYFSCGPVILATGWIIPIRSSRAAVLPPEVVGNLKILGEIVLVKIVQPVIIEALRSLALKMFSVVVDVLGEKFRELFGFLNENEKYIAGCATHYGFREKSAISVARYADKNGMKDLMCDGHRRLMELNIANRGDVHMRLDGVRLALFDEDEKSVDLWSENKFSLVINPNRVMRRSIECDHFPRVGRKRWYLVGKKKIYATSEVFMVSEDGQLLV